MLARCAGKAHRFCQESGFCTSGQNRLVGKSSGNFVSGHALDQLLESLQEGRAGRLLAQPGILVCPQIPISEAWERWENGLVGGGFGSAMGLANEPDDVAQRVHRLYCQPPHLGGVGAGWRVFHHLREQRDAAGICADLVMQVAGNPKAQIFERRQRASAL
jgi:hypothetical protein